MHEKQFEEDDDPDSAMYLPDPHTHTYEVDSLSETFKTLIRELT